MESVQYNGGAAECTQRRAECTQRRTERAAADLLEAVREEFAEGAEAQGKVIAKLQEDNQRLIDAHVAENVELQVVDSALADANLLTGAAVGSSRRGQIRSLAGELKQARASRDQWRRRAQDAEGAVADTDEALASVKQSIGSPPRARAVRRLADCFRGQQRNIRYYQQEETELRNEVRELRRKLEAERNQRAPHRGGDSAFAQEVHRLVYAALNARGDFVRNGYGKPGSETLAKKSDAARNALFDFLRVPRALSTRRPGGWVF